MTDWSYFGGVCLAYVGSTFNSLGNVLFTINKNTCEESPEYRLGKCKHWNILAVCCFIVGGLSDATSLALIPVSIWSANSVVSIPISTLYLRFILKEEIDPRHWFIIAGITLGALGATLSGNHNNQPDVLTELPYEINQPDAIILIVFFGLLLLVAFIYVRNTKRPNVIRAFSIYNMCGPIIAGTTNVFADIVVKVSLEFLKCWIFEPACQANKVYIAAICILPVFLISQLTSLSNMMSNFDVVTVIPMYQIVSIVESSILGIVLFQEIPTSIPGYVLSLVLILALIYYMMVFKDNVSIADCLKFRCNMFSLNMIEVTSDSEFASQDELQQISCSNIDLQGSVPFSAKYRAQPDVIARTKALDLHGIELMEAQSANSSLEKIHVLQYGQTLRRMKTAPSVIPNSHLHTHLKSCENDDDQRVSTDLSPMNTGSEKIQDFTPIVFTEEDDDETVPPTKSDSNVVIKSPVGNKQDEAVEEISAIRENCLSPNLSRCASYAEIELR